MSTSQLANSLRQLAACYAAWEAALHGAPEKEIQALGPDERSSMRAELAGLIGEPVVAMRKDTTWKRLRGLLVAYPSASLEPVRKRALLMSYEGLCEQDLPLHVANVLLRQYSAIKRTYQGHVRWTPSVASHQAAS